MLKHARQSGFSLLEVMVSLVVLTIGLLGVVKLESVALSSTTVASRRSIAALEAASLAASMHVNRSYWAGTDPSSAKISFTGTTVSADLNAPLLAAALPAGKVCESPVAANFCNGNAMAAYDLTKWALEMNTQIPGYTATINCGAVNPVSCLLQIFWGENAVALTNSETANAVNLTTPYYTLYIEP